jgi:hypothetical protein
VNTDRDIYEAPQLRTVGSLYDLTQGDIIRKNGNGQWCIFDKRLGSPDYWSMIPVADCS